MRLITSLILLLALLTVGFMTILRDSIMALVRTAPLPASTPPQP